MAQYTNKFYAPFFPTPKDLCKEELREFIGHKDEVNCVSYSSDFQFMVTGSDDQRVRVFNVKTKQCLIKLKGHEGAICSVAVSPCDKYFASGSYDKTARVWRTANGECLFTLRGHDKSISEVVFSPGAIYLCTSSWDRTAIIWNLEVGCLVKRFEGHLHAVQSCAFSYDFLLLATGSWDFTVRVWKLNHTEYRKALNDFKNKTDISEGNEERGLEDKLVESDGETENSDIDEHKESDGDEHGESDKGSNKSEENDLVLQGHEGNVHSVAFSKIGMLASGSWDRTVRLWNPNTGWCLRLLIGHEGWVKAVSFSHDSTYVASVAEDDSVKVWDIPSGKCIKSFEASTDLAQHCAFTPAGDLIASGAAIVAEKVKVKKDKKEEEEEAEAVAALLKQPPRGIFRSSVRQPSRGISRSSVRRERSVSVIGQS